jgi:hypothetical protein
LLVKFLLARATAPDILNDMTSTVAFVPETVVEARELIDAVKAERLPDLSHARFVSTWNAVAYLHPELHPDGVDEWPADLKPFAVEAWRRVERGELSDDELYPSDAQWCGLCDRIAAPTIEESTRRLSFLRRPMVRVGDIVRFRRPNPDEITDRMVIIEWNIDRGLARHLNTGMRFPPVQHVQFRDIEAVDHVDG